MAKKSEKVKPTRGPRRVQYAQDSWTEVDAEGSDSEMAQGRTSQEPFYTPLVTEAAERRLRKERAERTARQGEDQPGPPE